MSNWLLKWKKSNGFFWSSEGEFAKPNVCRTWVGSVWEFGWSKLKISKSFPDRTSEPGPNGSRTDFPDELLIRQGQVENDDLEHGSSP